MIEDQPKGHAIPKKNENERGKLWAQIRWKKRMLPIAKEKKETIGSMADARPKGRSNRLFFSLQRRSLTFSFIIFLHYLSFSWSHLQEVVFDRRSEMKFQDNFKMRSMKRESEGKFICLFYFFSIILDVLLRQITLWWHQDYMIERN